MKRLILYILFFILPLSIWSQDITVQAEYPPVVQAGQQFSVSWTVNDDGGQFSAPSFEGFYKLAGPQTSYSSSTQIINGKISHQTSNSFVYYLQAVNAGKFTISPASYTLKNKTYSSEPMNIEVTGAGATASQNNQPSQNAVHNNTHVENAGGDLFLDLYLNRKDIYIGEGIVATIKIYTRKNLAGINEIKYPPFTNFLKNDIETPQLTALRQESINGVIYGTGVLQQFILYPQVSGEITIDPVQVTVLIQQKSGRSDPFFGDFFSNYENVPEAIVSKAVKVNVKPLPGQQPADFSGVVGKLTLKSSLNKDSVRVNDAVNLKIMISGNGNLKLAEAPKLKLSPDVEVYDPKITEDIKNSVNGASGQKTFEYLLIPRHYGDFTVPSVSYSYFNPASDKYERLTTGEFHIHARKGPEQGTSGVTVYGGVSREDVKYVGKDIRFIRNTAGRLSKSSELLLSKRSYYSGFAMALLAFLVVLFVRREHIRRNADIITVRNRIAGKIAAQRLREASACMKQNEIDRFHEEILRALWGYLSDKLNIPVSDLTRNNAFAALKEKGIEDEKINNLADILDKCEYARFAPASSENQAGMIYEGASQFIKTVENSIG